MTTIAAIETGAPSHGRWVWAPVVLLGAMLVGLGSMAAIAVDDPTFSVERDYYAKAVSWDGTQAQMAENQRLAFRLSAPASLAVNGGSAELRVTLRDAGGQSITGAALTAEAFANAHAGQTVSLALDEVGDGVYSARFPVRHFGLWEFRVTVRRGADRFTQALRADVTPEGSP